jgi:site-specific DNA recombinase
VAEAGGDALLGLLVAGGGTGGELPDASQGVVKASPSPSAAVIHSCLPVQEVVAVLVRAAVYARISEDRDGEGLGVERQIRDCLKEAERLGWTVTDKYVDNSVSAYSAKPRPEYNRMIRDVEAGHCNAVVAYDLDRLSRNPREIEHIIDLAEKGGVRLATVTGAYDLATPTGRLHARIKASVARHESEQTAARMKRKLQDRAERGLPHGEEAYGWKRTDGHDDLDHAEAAIVREIAERLLAGESIKAVTNSLNERGVPPPYDAARRKAQAEGKGQTFGNRNVEWSRVTVRHVALRERNAGIRVHQGREIGPGNWEPIYDVDTFRRLQALLKDPSRKVTTGSAYRYLLTGIAKCSKCNRGVRVIKHAPRRGQDSQRNSYVCGHCHGISRNQESVDRLIIKLVTRRLAMPDAKEIFVPAPDPALVTEAETLRAKLDLVADQFAADEIDGQQLKRITATLRPRLREVEAKLRPVVIDLEDLATPDIAERWESIPLERRRAVVDFLLDITLLPRGKNAPRRFDPNSVKAKWKR